MLACFVNHCGVVCIYIKLFTEIQDSVVDVECVQNLYQTINHST